MVGDCGAGIRVVLVVWEVCFFLRFLELDLGGLGSQGCGAVYERVGRARRSVAGLEGLEEGASWRC